MTQNTNHINVEVSGGYKPESIVLKQGVPADITFTRTTNQGCLNVVKSTSLSFQENLPLNEPKKIMINTDKTGEFDFNCGMDMFHGKVIIEK